MKKPTAAEIAAEFARGAQAEGKHNQCKTCAMPEEIREAVRLCLEAEPPMTAAALARQLKAKGYKITPEALKDHYRDHVKRAA